ncbi:MULTISPECIES: sensor histidine kinase [Gordonia]|uniref:histidine kinase n=4 Tax=Gordoniaceae TaxID=85026 RepID=L7LL19_9ACTN|nr:MULTISPECIES: histidine kinase [Gordonia]AUH67169.1 sensor histidine kinase [Gordonia sp. YC-JH1]KXT58454.1 histidine kinase [Gordonia sp. QH-12]MBY4569064.1 sensor histidine kinase [Gordonia sihwensis]GAC61549.1 putative two-component histidine kinase [Gordonia sihwensis NBRC 108236]
MSGELIAIAVLGVALATVLIVVALRTRRVVSTPHERAVHDTLHTAALAARPLRRGLTAESAAEAAGPLRALTGADGLALYDAEGSLLTFDGDEQLWTPPMRSAAAALAADTLANGRHCVQRDPADGVGPLRSLLAAPLMADGIGIGALVVASVTEPGPGRIGAITEVARYAASQLQLAELDASRARLDRAEVLALRAQISPHFIYNALNTIASFVRTDPDRARELILDFADFTRYSFRAAGEYTVLADELRNIDRYLTLERARFGPGLTVKVQVAPEVLGVVVPFLALQPLVENAVRHGLAGRRDGTISIVARNAGPDCLLSVEDDGVGMDPELLRTGAIDALDPAGPRESDGAHVGLTNVDQRLRAAFGNDYGLVVETAVGAGTKVSMRIPKFAAGIHAGGPAAALRFDGREESS